jgi:hypothetical protein
MNQDRSDALPELDETIAALDEPSRRHAAETSTRRAGLELHGAAAFTAVTQALLELRAPAAIVSLCANAIAEELRHSEIYLTIARAYAGHEVEAPRPSAIEVPRYSSAGPDAERLLQVIGMCCVNETMACSFLELCYSGVKGAFVRGGIREILADEIRHARVGWAYLGSDDMGPAERLLISTWLLPILSDQWHHWRNHIATLPEVDLAEHGCPSATAIQTASLASIRELVLPGFARAGIDVSAATRWVDAGAG